MSIEDFDWTELGLSSSDSTKIRSILTFEEQHLTWGDAALAKALRAVWSHMEASAHVRRRAAEWRGVPPMFRKLAILALKRERILGEESSTKDMARTLAITHGMTSGFDKLGAVAEMMAPAQEGGIASLLATEELISRAYEAAIQLLGDEDGSGP